MPSDASFRRAARRVLAPEVLADLEAASRVAATVGAPVLLVGGMVRDVLLGRPSSDLDLVVVGEPGALAAGLAAALSGRVAATSELATWRLELPAGRRLDLAAARRESYPAPGALPATAPGDLASDLARRDFSVNAMALKLGRRWSAVIDPHGGRADLAAGLLRVLHPASFRDDPTRVLRGIELAVRLGFDFEERTAGLARAALAAGVLEALSPARWQLAWQRAYAPLLRAGADAVARGLRLAEELGLLAALSPGLTLAPAALARAVRIAERAAGTRLDDARPARLLARALAWEDGAAAAALARRWPATAETARWSSFPGRLAAARDQLAGGAEPAPSLLDAALSGFDAEELDLLELEPGLAAALARYREIVLPFGLAITGHDLVGRGHPPGPGLGAALERTRRARLDGLLGADEELEYACRQLEQER